MSLVIQQGLSFWIGIFLALTSLSVLLHPSHWMELIGSQQEKPASLCLIAGGINTSLGAFILGFHWNWEGWAMALTIVGLLAAVRGALCLIFPGFLGRMINTFILLDQDSGCMKMRLAGIVPLLLSLGILRNWWLL